MYARSTRTAGRTGDRPAGGRVQRRRPARLLVLSFLVLLTISAISASRVTAIDGADTPEPMPVPDTATAAPTPAEEGSVATPAPDADATVEPEPEPPASPAPEPAPPEPEPSPAPEPAPPEASAAPAAEPVDPPPAEPPPDGSDAWAEPAPELPAADEPEAPQAPAVVTVAQNVSTVFQVLWQVQHGCRTYCYGTTQTQSGSQAASTTQDATADAGDTAGSAAVAANASTTVQFLWQYQVGCLAFCYGTTMSQSALQAAQTAQLATAIATLGAVALNLAETLQSAWQIQVGCAQECHDAAESQSLVQSETTSQVAGAMSGGTAEMPDAVELGEAAMPSLPAWLIVLAANAGATIELIYQLQEAPCLSRCVGGAQIQEGVQRASVAQLAIALTARADAPVAAPSAAPPVTGDAGSPPEAAAEPVLEPGSPTAPAASIAGASGAPFDSWGEPGRPTGRRSHATGRREHGGVASPPPVRSRDLRTPPVAVRTAGRAPRRRDRAGDPPHRARSRTLPHGSDRAGATSAAPAGPASDTEGLWRLIALATASLALIAGAMAVRPAAQRTGEILD